MITAENIQHIFKTFENLNPTPQTELCYEDPYTLLVAVMLSAQATDVSVNKATKELFKIAKTPRAIVELEMEALLNCLKTLNFYPTKAKNLKALSTILLEQHDGIVPSSREALESLPGVGRKTANVVLNIAFQQPTLAVDTHIHRVANRLGLCTTKTPMETELALLSVIPTNYLMHAHHWLILHGRYICKARKPECTKCPVSRWCSYYVKNLMESSS